MVENSIVFSLCFSKQNYEQSICNDSTYVELKK